MTNPFTFLRRSLLLVVPLLALAITGCFTTNNQAVKNPSAPDPTAGDTNSLARLHVGDTVTVVLQGLPEELPPMEKPIREDGAITLDYIGDIIAAGKTAGELEKIIHARYVPKYYKRLTVTVKTTNDRVYFVSGEVKAPGRLMYSGSLTVTKAITSAGGFTDFADQTDVTLIRSNGERLKLDCKAILRGKQPDPPVYPGDQIQVGRRII